MFKAGERVVCTVRWPHEEKPETFTGVVVLADAKFGYLVRRDARSADGLYDAGDEEFVKLDEVKAP